MKLMGSRLEKIDQAIQGYEQTGVSLIYFDEKGLSPAGVNDEIGVYYFIPLVARLFDLNAQQAASCFYYAIISFSFILSFVGACFLFRSWLSRGWALLGLIWLAIISINSGAVYSVPPSTIVAVLPWFLYFSKKEQLTPFFLGIGFLSGTAIGFSHSIRMNGAAGLMIFMGAAVVFLIQYSLKDKLKLVAAIALGLLIPILCFSHLSGKRDAYLIQQSETYQPVKQRYLFWHSIYIGFGYLNNPLGIEYNDWSAINKVQSISPNTENYSKEYVEILKKEVFRLARTEKNFVLHTVFAKIGVMLFFFVYSANLGLIAAYYYPNKWPLNIPFLMAILFSAAPGILVMPYRRYILGYMAFSFFYGLVSLNEAVEQGVLSRIKTGLRSRSQNK
jgi:hypothetical protein